MDDCIDGSGLILGMNDAYGPFQWTPMQDGATPHNSKLTMSCLKNYCNILEGWPSNSPDLNPIENLLAILKAKVDEFKPQSVEDLLQYGSILVFETWGNLDIQIIYNLIDSIPSPLQSVINNDGFPTEY